MKTDSGLSAYILPRKRGFSECMGANHHDPYIQRGYCPFVIKELAAGPERAVRTYVESAPAACRRASTSYACAGTTIRLERDIATKRCDSHQNTSLVFPPHVAFMLHALHINCGCMSAVSSFKHIFLVIASIDCA